MSNIVLQPNASGTGNITISTPNTNTDRTLNIPDVAGDIVTTGDTGSITGTMIGSLPAGSVLQVVSFNIATLVNNNTNGATIASGIKNSITPTSANSKILIVCDVSVGKNSTNTYGELWIYRGGSSLEQMENSLLYTGDAGQNYSRVPITYLDSPATTSSTEYEIYFKKEGTTGEMYINPDGGRSTMTLMEIAG